TRIPKLTNLRFIKLSIGLRPFLHRMAESTCEAEKILAVGSLIHCYVVPGSRIQAIAEVLLDDPCHRLVDASSTFRARLDARELVLNGVHRDERYSHGREWAYGLRSSPWHNSVGAVFSLDP